VGFAVVAAELDEAERVLCGGSGACGDEGQWDSRLGMRGEDMFLLEEQYLRAYAKYFGRFVDTYKAEGIRVGMVMPQMSSIRRRIFRAVLGA
jgi:glucosylceramidase